MRPYLITGSLACTLAMAGVWAFAQQQGRPTSRPGNANITTRPAATQPTSRPTTQPTTRPETQPAGAPRVEMRIQQGDDWGWIVIELDPEKAPITVKNFLRYVDEGYYNGTIFHRVIPDFMIQGGGFSGLGQKKDTGLHEPITNESRNGLANVRGTISMARTGAPHSATSQFFINVADNTRALGPRPPTNWGYTVFGKVVEGMDVVDKIKAVETQIDPSSPRPEKSQPLNPPKIVVAQRVK